MRGFKHRKLPRLLRLDSKTLNIKAFEEWQSNHRNYQTDAVQSMVDIDKGQISIPTGTGKTRIQTDLIVSDMIKKTQEGLSGIYGIGAHRLLLCGQLLDNIVDTAIEAGLEFDILFVGSARRDVNDYNARYKNSNAKIRGEFTTRGEQIEKFSLESKSSGRHIILVSTYHSIRRLENIGEIDIFTADEAHNLEIKVFKANYTKIYDKIKRKFFFTATRQILGDHLGMNNFEYYGRLLYALSPRDMIERMEIVFPVVQQIDTKDDLKNYTNDNMMVKTVINGFTCHEDALKKVSAEPEKIAAKMMVSAEFNTLKIKAIYDDIDFITFCKENSIRAFMFSSSHGGDYRVDFTPKNRKEIMKEMNSLRDNEKAIFIHIDILSEGIDLPSITAILPFREMNEIKMIQTLGRGARLLKEDRENYYKGIITSEETQKFRRGEQHFLIKPCFFVLLSVYYENLNGDFWEDMIRKIYTLYGYSPIRITPSDQGISIQYDEVDNITGRIHEKKGAITELDQVFYNIFEKMKDKEVDGLETVGDFCSFIEKYKLDERKVL